MIIPCGPKPHARITFPMTGEEFSLLVSTLMVWKSRLCPSRTVPKAGVTAGVEYDRTVKKLLRRQRSRA